MSSDEQSKSHLPWHLRVGQRVAVRHTLADGDPSGARFNDVTGELLAADEEGATVDGRHGAVTIAWDTVVAAKEIPPRAARRGRPHQAIGIDDLERLMVNGMPGLLQLPIGDWLLRTAKGYTGRANSALVVGDPGLPVEQAINEVAAAYTELGRPTLFQLPGETGYDPAAHPVGAAVLARGGRVFQQTLVMTAAVREVAIARPAPNTAIEVAPMPSERWWSATSDRARENRAIIEQMTADVDGAFLTASRREGDLVATARIAFSPGWVGLFDLFTAPDWRGNGYGRAVVGEAARDAELRGLPSFYLQVSADNEAAIGLYDSLGFTVHHEYWYARLD